VVVDTSAAGAPRPALAALADNLKPGEVLSVLRSDRTLATVTGDAAVEDTQAPLPWLQSLVRRLPAARLEGPLQALATLPGGLRLRLQGDLARVDRQLAATASRYSIYFAALAGAIGLAWLLVEVGLLRRMALLTRRANALSVELQRAPRLPALDVADLRAATNWASGRHAGRPAGGRANTCGESSCGRTRNASNGRPWGTRS
jgi:hypothetical protein